MGWRDTQASHTQQCFGHVPGPQGQERTGLALRPVLPPGQGLPLHRARSGWTAGGAWGALHSISSAASLRRSVTRGSYSGSEQRDEIRARVEARVPNCWDQAGC